MVPGATPALKLTRSSRPGLKYAPSARTIVNAIECPGSDISATRAYHTAAAAAPPLDAAAAAAGRTCAARHEPTTAHGPSPTTSEDEKTLGASRKRLTRRTSFQTSPTGLFTTPEADTSDIVWVTWVGWVTRVRVELSTILIKYAFKISIQFWSRRDNSVVPLA